MDLGNQRSFRPLDSEQVPVAQHHKNIDENGKARPVLLQPYPPSVIRAEGFEYTSNRDPCERCIGYIAKGFIHKNMNWTSPQHVWIEAVCEHVKADTQKCGRCFGFSGTSDAECVPIDGHLKDAWKVFKESHKKLKDADKANEVAKAKKKIAQSVSDAARSAKQAVEASTRIADAVTLLAHDYRLVHSQNSYEDGHVNDEEDQVGDRDEISSLPSLRRSSSFGLRDSE
ncbi:hypothetical protein B0T11DRAFT_351214 [Plectosphaerella cucumerina]|uniref:Uncharacterized protein n=1 Tax=Plectosphaerella cucumerina TaxID=40658 RepID=A0A8K0TJM2_9PEZI|nr:hypothetical protein B0T11DRAFT_351214 [Plectosphaerella cucumerina]